MVLKSREAVEKQTWKIDLWTWREGRRGTWKLTLPYVKQIANGNLLYGSGNSNGLCINLERWDGKGDGREVQKGGDICVCC